MSPSSKGKRPRKPEAEAAAGARVRPLHAAAAGATGGWVARSPATTRPRPWRRSASSRPAGWAGSSCACSGAARRRRRRDAQRVQRMRREEGPHDLVGRDRHRGVADDRRDLLRHGASGPGVAAAGHAVELHLVALGAGVGDEGHARGHASDRMGVGAQPLRRAQAAAFAGMVGPLDFLSCLLAEDLAERAARSVGCRQLERGRSDSAQVRRRTGRPCRGRRRPARGATGRQPAGSSIPATGATAAIWPASTQARMEVEEGPVRIARDEDAVAVDAERRVDGVQQPADEGDVLAVRARVCQTRAPGSATCGVIVMNRAWRRRRRAGHVTWIAADSSHPCRSMTTGSGTRPVYEGGTSRT